MREKLIELLAELCAFKGKGCVGCDTGKYYRPECKTNLFGKIADRLIANGVTVQKWIPVAERFPEENGYYLCVVCVSAVNQHKEYRRMILFWEDNVWIDMANSFRTKKPLYWMPLPEPPKGE